MPADMPTRVRVYVWLLLALNLALLSLTFPSDWPEAKTVALVLLVLLGVAGYTWEVALPTRGGITFGFIVQLAAIPLLGLWGAALVGTLAPALQMKGWPPLVRMFNAAQFGLSSFAAAVTYLVMGGTTTLYEAAPRDFLLVVVVPFFVASVVHCVVNVVLLAGVVHLHKGTSVLAVVIGTLRPSGVANVGYALIGLLLAVLWDGAGIGPLSALLVVAPLYVARWAWSQFDEQQKAYERTVRALVRAVETKDLYTRGHSERVSKASVMIARATGMGEERTETLRFAGILHDVGKIGVPTRVLQKTGRLTDEEFQAIALHPVRGLDMVRDIEFLAEAYAGILHHHERLDGRGYPMGLTADRIPEFARIIAVADAFDSMTSTRSYRQARPVVDAVEELRRCAGSQFEPRFVEALVAALELEPWAVAVVSVEEAAAAPGPVPSFDHDDPSAQLPPRVRHRAPVPRQEAS